MLPVPAEKEKVHAFTPTPAANSFPPSSTATVSSASVTLQVSAVTPDHGA